MLSSRAVLLGLCLVAPASALAQDPPPPWVRLTLYQVEPTMVEEFISVQREFTELHKKAGTKWRHVSRTEVFGDTYRFMVGEPFEELATFDDPAEVDASLINRLRRCIQGRQSYAVRTMPDYDNPPPEDELPELMVVNVAHIFPGREQEYIDIMASDYLPHFDEAELHHVNGSLAFGGESGFIHVFYFPDFAELDKGSPVMRALGTDGAQAVTKKFSGIVSSSELWVSRILPEVSFVPEPKESE